MIPVKVDQLFISNMGFVVLLRGIEDPRVLQIFIGAAEAQAIAIHLNRVEIPRPLTHDLLKSILELLECRLVRVEVCDLKEGTFFARLVLDREGTETQVDCRPSDALALALRCASPVYVAAKVMDEAGRILDPAQGTNEAKSSGTHDPKSAEKATSPLQKLKLALEKAIQDERYEDAARLRDEIKTLESIH